MSARAAALWAIPFAIVGLLLRVAAHLTDFTLLVDPFPAGILLELLAFGLSVGLPLAAYLLLTRRDRVAPATWVLDPAGRRIVAGLAPRPAGLTLIGVALWAPLVLDTERVAGESYRQFAGFDPLAVVSLIGAALLFTALAVSVATGRPWVALDRDGIVRQDLFRRDRVGWDELTADQPTWWTRLRTRALQVGRIKLPVSSLHIDPTLMAFTIRNYRRVPELREQIGTAESLALLHDAYRSSFVDTLAP
ncbi:hypothetical protein [Actinoplanes palleronii]|uniref:Uncharacterized protein n=1 Tax=Actinoplanes palleronii TaxID=113570 RepID=A0ABQ4B8Y0_9ACTN|nr:hypothetical protein [Actinoplanes palleronii]GIE67159.1 hypothetical protein Apa02nite_032670 [Actinoplanes palleronii]